MGTSQMRRGKMIRGSGMNHESPLHTGYNKHLDKKHHWIILVSPIHSAGY